MVDSLLLFAEGDLMLFAYARFVYVLLNLLCILIVLAAAIRPAHGDEGAPAFSYGAGQYELIIFTDYFCPPCQKMEKELDKTIDEMIGRGGVKVTFVDLPIYKLTPLYAKYFLYAANAAPTYKEALRARQLLFEKAYRIGAITEQHLENALQEANIPIKPYDTRPSLSEYNHIAKKYKVNSTPTFVFIYSPTDVRKYAGSEPIRKGMAEFLQELGQP
jgi:protein-disulfide isomerase